MNEVYYRCFYFAILILFSLSYTSESKKNKQDNPFTSDCQPPCVYGFCSEFTCYCKLGFNGTDCGTGKNEIFNSI
jgi:hypothetical protein